MVTIFAFFGKALKESTQLLIFAKTIFEKSFVIFAIKKNLIFFVLYACERRLSNLSVVRFTIFTMTFDLIIP